MARIVQVRNPRRASTPQPGDKWTLAYETHVARYGSPQAAREYADHVTRQNPFMESLVGGVGTGTGLALAAGVAGPFIVRRLKGALSKVGVRNPRRFDPTGMDKLRGDDETSYYRKVADFIASQYPGTTISESETTESVYVRLPGAREEIRFSSHSKYGMNRPTHIQFRSFKRMGEQVDRAIRAAFAGSTNYRFVPTWKELEAA